MSDLNFDAMNHAELMAFWSANRTPTREEAVAIVGTKVTDPVDAVETLAAYACAKACAVKLRLEGQISRALTYEQHCDIYYEQLPEAVRW